jgi:RHH-type rel operon transcriptional repressor/antitoxin RelB
MLAIRLPPEVEARLERLAKRTGRTKTYYAREAAVIEGKSKTYTLEDVERDLGLEG